MAETSKPTGLIVALVIFIICAVAFAILSKILYTDKTNLEKTVDDLKKQIEKNKQDLNIQIKEYKDALASLKQDLDDANQNIAKLNNNLNEDTTKISELNTKITDTTKNYDLLVSRISLAISNLSTYGGDIDSLLTKLNNIKTIVLEENKRMNAAPSSDSPVSKLGSVLSTINTLYNKLNIHKSNLEKIQRDLEVKTDISGKLVEQANNTLSVQNADVQLLSELNKLYNLVELDPSLTTDLEKTKKMNEIITKYIEVLNTVNDVLLIGAKSVKDLKTNDITTAVNAALQTGKISAGGSSNIPAISPTNTIISLINGINEDRAKTSAVAMTGKIIQINDDIDYSTLTIDNIKQFVISSLAYLNKISRVLTSNNAGGSSDFKKFGQLTFTLTTDMISSGVELQQATADLTNLRTKINDILTKLGNFAILSDGTITENINTNLAESINNRFNTLLDPLKKVLQRNRPSDDGKNYSIRIPRSYLENTILHGFSYGGGDAPNTYVPGMKAWDRIDSRGDNVALVITTSNFDSTDNNVFVGPYAVTKGGSIKNATMEGADHNLYIYNPYGLNIGNTFDYDQSDGTIDLEKALGDKGITFDKRTIINAPTPIQNIGATTAAGCKTACVGNSNCHAALLNRATTNTPTCVLYGPDVNISKTAFDSQQLAVFVPPSTSSKGRIKVKLWPN